jgi:hypothetical protein
VGGLGAENNDSGAQRRAGGAGCAACSQVDCSCAKARSFIGSWVSGMCRVEGLPEPDPGQVRSADDAFKSRDVADQLE